MMDDVKIWKKLGVNDHFSISITFLFFYKKYEDVMIYFNLGITQLHLWQNPIADYGGS